ncbi:hypothetical protein CDAR_59021 [Caerostris darwini]|uniref:Ribosomal protein L5 n=1 Tax=Caerostris darwini TaxID=1538125 RepID=A0AAV4X1X4_9ARAC|nr:hypothetical protein CDAR_59021 [Caerostris darwini]
MNFSIVTAIRYHSRKHSHSFKFKLNRLLRESIVGVTKQKLWKAQEGQFDFAFLVGGLSLEVCENSVSFNEVFERHPFTELRGTRSLLSLPRNGSLSIESRVKVLFMSLPRILSHYLFE